MGGALLGFAVERISVGMQHVAAQASPLNKKTGLPQLGSEFSGLFMWGRGREGQLGVATYQDNSVPKMVDELKGRRVLQVPPCTPLEKEKKKKKNKIKKTQEKERKEKNRIDYTFRSRFSEKLSIILGCPGIAPSKLLTSSSTIL